MSVVGHFFYVLSTLILGECSVWTSGFLLALGDALKTLFSMMFHFVFLEIN